MCVAVCLHILWEDTYTYVNMHECYTCAQRCMCTRVCVRLHVDVCMCVCVARRHVGNICLYIIRFMPDDGHDVPSEVIIDTDSPLMVKSSFDTEIFGSTAPTDIAADASTATKARTEHAHMV